MMYYYTDANRQAQGPVPREKLMELLNAGVLNPASLIAEQGSQEWKPLSSILDGTPAVTATAIPVARRNEPLAIWSLVLSLAGALCCGIFGSVAAVICGHMARSRIKKDPALDGDGMALAGLIIGYLGLAFWIIYLIVFGAAMFVGIMQDIQKGNF